MTEVKESSSIGRVTDPFATQAVSTDGTTAYVQVTYTAKDTDLTDGDHTGLEKALEAGRDQGLTVEASGNALAPPAESHAAEVIGFALAAVILAITFGSLIAAGLPLLTALVGGGVSPGRRPGRRTPPQAHPGPGRTRPAALRRPREDRPADRRHVQRAPLHGVRTPRQDKDSAPQPKKTATAKP
ncbi:hypothetical protein C5746_01100 [Streptomyces atratus]|uniref:Membrane transport protein MMPL domain-containing protein n=1 Tax=Streptomyces atratus TaxID=1893 RepID=A0A2Z5J668_STRAR|nr:hypothetical protein C5746_01100 [Streptomyces atratus]